MSGPGFTIGIPVPKRYKLVRMLGSGTSGTVYLAHDSEMDRDVALKVLSQSNISKEIRARFLREAQALARTAHPNVVKLYDANVDGDVLYLSMELVEGQSLAARLRTGPLEPDAALTVVHALLAGLGHCHAHGVLHRDIKPANVMLEGTCARLVDFGLARVEGADALTSAGQVLGSPAYLAPEVLRAGCTSAASDLFAVAATGLELLTGKRLDDGCPTGSLKACYARMATGEYLTVARKLLAGRGPMGDALLAALALEPARRPADAAAFARLFPPPVPTGGRPAAKPSRRPATARTGRRRPGILLAAAGALLAAVGVAGAFALIHRPPRLATPTPGPSLRPARTPALEELIGPMIEALAPISDERDAAIERLLNEYLAAPRPATPPPRAIVRRYAALAHERLRAFLLETDAAWQGFAAWHHDSSFSAKTTSMLVPGLSKLELRRRYVREKLMPSAPQQVARLRAGARRLRELAALHLLVLARVGAGWAPRGHVARSGWDVVLRAETLLEDGREATPAWIARVTAGREDWLALLLKSREHGLRARWAEALPTLRRAAEELVAAANAEPAEPGDAAAAEVCRALALELCNAMADRPSRSGGLDGLLDALAKAAPADVKPEADLGWIDRELAACRGRRKR